MCLYYRLCNTCQKSKYKQGQQNVKTKLSPKDKYPEYYISLQSFWSLPGFKVVKLLIWDLVKPESTQHSLTQPTQNKSGKSKLSK